MVTPPAVSGNGSSAAARSTRRRTALQAGMLSRVCKPDELGFHTTLELGVLDEALCQERAISAIRFGIASRMPGWNIFVMGPEGTGKRRLIDQILSAAAPGQPTPPDACYVNNFDDPHHPVLISLPAGMGRRLTEQMDRTVIEVRGAIRAAFEATEYSSRREALDDALRTRREEAIDAFAERAARAGFAVLRTPVGMGLTPVRDGKPLDDEAMDRLPEDVRQGIRADLDRLQDELAGLLRQVMGWEREHRQRIRALDRDVTGAAVSHLIDELRAEFHEHSAVQAYLAAVQHDVVENAAQLLAEGEPAQRDGSPQSPPWSRRYQVNLLVDNSRLRGAPIVVEDHPTLANLVGRVEHSSILGALVTDFTLIRSGALHRANGGYLVLDARRLLSEPLAWEGLKRALRSGLIRLESMAEAMSLISTVSLEPMPMQLDVKVILIGNRRLHYLLSGLDPDYPDLFKIESDLDDAVDRTASNARKYARIVAGLIAREGLRPMSADGVARVIDEMARRADDGRRLSTNMRFLSDLVCEADQLASTRARPPRLIGRREVENVIRERRMRRGRVGRELLDAITRGLLLIDTHGHSIGQVNALTVAELGESVVAWPTRVTARVRLGRGEVVDIEREVEQGGPIHSKGVLILAGFLGERYASDWPLSLHASLVLEQTYGSVEGDSASLAELCALLSAIGQLPIDQALAITGSVDQLGEVQPVGAVTAKVEGFFDVCRRRGLTGKEGVIVPAAGAPGLMLRDEVVEAVRAGRFGIYAVRSVDEAMELLTGLPAGHRRAGAGYARHSVNGQVSERLRDFAEHVRGFEQASRGA